MRLHHLALRTHALEPCATFYRSVIGLPEVRRRSDSEGNLRAIWLNTGGVVVMIERAGPDEKTPGGGELDLIAFETSREKSQEYRARFAAANVVIEAETEYTMYVRDPDGRRVGVSCYVFEPGEARE